MFYMSAEFSYCLVMVIINIVFIEIFFIINFNLIKLDIYLLFFFLDVQEAQEYKKSFSTALSKLICLV